MTLFIKKQELNVLPELDSETAMEIYQALKIKDANRLFLEDDIPTEYSVEVETEMKRLEADMISKMNSGKVTTETGLKASMSSDLLDVSVVCTDVRIWSDGLPDQEPNFETYKESFNQE